MATSFVFNNQTVKLPGSYSQFKSGVTNPALSLSYGNVLLVDTGSGANYGGGAGVSGTLATNKLAVYSTNSLKEFRDAVGGGILWDIAEKLFQPNGAGAGNGISTLYYVRGAATVPSQTVITTVGGGANGGVATIKYKNEGPVGNGVTGDQTLAKTTYTTTTVGSATDTHTIKVNEGAGAITLGTYTVVGTPTTTAVATALAASVNATTSTHGYTATSNNAIVTVTARNPKALETAATANAYVSTYVVTGTAAGTTVSPYSGGVAGTTLTRGIAVTMSAGVNDNTKFIFKFYRGTFKGLDENGIPFDNIYETSTKAELLIQSPELNNMTAFVTWMNTDAKFGSLFKLSSSTVSGTGVIDATDLTSNAGFNKFNAGTCTYSTTDLDNALTAVADLNYSYILADNYEDNAQSSNNGKLLAHTVDSNTFGDKCVVIGGGRDSSKFAEGTTNSSIETAKYYNTDRVIVCHGGTKKNTTLVADGYVAKPSIYKAAAVLGRIAGLPPQVPVTFKSLLFDGDLHVLSNKEKTQALDKGVLITSPVSGGRVEVLQGVNSLQSNTYLINPDATTYSIQLRRMISQLNTEIVVNANATLLKNPNGTNRNTLTIQDVKSFVEGYLKSKTATVTQDDMVISVRNVNVVLNQDAYQATYDVVLNTEITKLFFTGTIYLNF